MANLMFGMPFVQRLVLPTVKWHSDNSTVRAAEGGVPPAFARSALLGLSVAISSALCPRNDPFVRSG